MSKLLNRTLMPVKKIVILLTVFIGSFLQLSAQIEAEEHDLVQFSGIVLSTDTTTEDAQSIFYCHIAIKNTGRGTTSNLEGLFSVVAHENDTILFSALGYKPNYVVIPDGLEKGDSYSILHFMEPDTLLLEESIVYPWPTPDQFRREFLALDIKDDHLARLEKIIGREVPIDFIPRRSENTIGPSLVISGPFSAIADFIRDSDWRKVNRYRRKLGILDSIQQQQQIIKPNPDDK